jgi:hypothetical protein
MQIDSCDQSLSVEQLFSVAWNDRHSLITCLRASENLQHLLEGTNRAGHASFISARTSFSLLFLLFCLRTKKKSLMNFFLPQYKSEPNAEAFLTESADEATVCEA